MQGYSFSDPTSKNKNKSSLNGYSGNTVSRMNVAGNQMRNSMTTGGGGGGGAGLPVSKYGSGSRNTPVKTTPQPQVQSTNNNQGGNNGLMQLIQSNPQIKNLLVNAMTSGNQQQLQNVLSLLQSFMKNGSNSNTQTATTPVKPTPNPAANVQHCNAPKYGSIMNAVKGINLNKINDMSQSSSAKAAFIYYKKTEETNFINYKLVFRFDKGDVKSFVYSNFLLSKTIQNDPNFLNYLITSDTSILSEIINETDFSATNMIKCIDLKVMFNGGINNVMTNSAFGSGAARNPYNQPQMNQGYNPGMGMNTGYNQMGGMQPNRFNGYGGQSNMGYGGQMSQPQMGYRPAYNGGFISPSSQMPSQNNGGGTFMINKY